MVPFKVAMAGVGLDICCLGIEGVDKCLAYESIFAFLAELRGPTLNFLNVDLSERELS